MNLETGMYDYPTRSPVCWLFGKHWSCKQMHVLDEITRLIILVKGILCRPPRCLYDIRWMHWSASNTSASSSTKRFGCFLLLGVNRVSLTIN